MPKRLHDTNIWRGLWFRKLSPESKILWLYLKDNCDCAGIFDQLDDIEQIVYLTGCNITDKNFYDLAKQIIVLDKKRLLLIDFIEFQYGNLTPSHKMYKKITSELSKYDISYPIDTVSIQYKYSIDTVKDKDIDTIKDKFIKEGGVGETKTNALEPVLSQDDHLPSVTMPQPIIPPNSSKSVWQSRHSEFIHAGPDEWIPYDFQSGKQWAMLFDCNYNPDGLIFSAVDYKKYCIETKTSGRFVKLPHNWLRDGDFSTNWIDEIEKKNSNKPKQETKEERRERILKELG